MPHCSYLSVVLLILPSNLLILLSNLLLPAMAFPTVLTFGRSLEHKDDLLTCLSFMLTAEPGSHRRIFRKAWERKVSMQESHRTEMKYRPQFTSGNLKVLDFRPRSSCPVDLCSLPYEKRGCSSFHITPTMQLPTAQWGLSCMAYLAISFLWSFLVLSC